MDHRRISAKRLGKQRDRAKQILERLDDGVLKTVEYRSGLSNEPDGFSGGSQGQGASGEISDPTGNSVLRLVEGNNDPDPQQVSCERIGSAFQAMWKSLEEADKAWDVILHVSESIRGRQTTLSMCQACLRDDVPNVGDDRIRSGYCRSCFKAWCRSDAGTGRQDRFTFELARRELKLVPSDGPKHVKAETA